MGTVIAVASVVLALIAAGCIAYIAWEMTSDAQQNHSSTKHDRSKRD
jgi:hypothetical protein